MKRFTRRSFLNKIIAAQAGLWLGNFAMFSMQAKNQVKITAIKAMQLDFQFDGCLIRIDTDAGISGYGEAGVNGKIARDQIEYLDWALQRARGGGERLIGADPISIERHYHRMIETQYPMPAPVGTISGIDIALWDLAGKILGQPVYKLLGGPFRNGCLMYSHGSALKNMLDPDLCRKWAEYIKQQPEGFTSFKIGVGFPVNGPFHETLKSDELKLIKQGFTNIRKAVGDDIEIGLHCHGEFNTPSAIALANSVQDLNIVYIEDPLNPRFSEGWTALKRGTGVPVMTGEKLESVHHFKPFLDSHAIDIIHPDISFAGGFTGCMKIADYASLTRIPVALHNVGTLVRTYASAHLSMAIQDFYRSESHLGEANGPFLEQMAAEDPPLVRNSVLKVNDKPGLGIVLNESFLKSHLAPGEPWWG